MGRSFTMSSADRLFGSGTTRLFGNGTASSCDSRRRYAAPCVAGEGVALSGCLEPHDTVQVREFRAYLDGELVS
ncbi:hypothetical protein ABT352_27230 [Streptosporangium sp. NPDC000563]|uniref:hypothetical protein n=1 Tax=Streptosporangium sp. NPDC000563 TaxID=3154366 RepID=UPI00332C6D88